MELTKEILEQVLDEKLVAQTKAFDSKLDTRFEAQTKAFDARFEAQSKSIDAKFEAQTKAFDAKLDARFEAQTKAFDSKLDARFEAQTKAFDSKLDAQSKVLMAHSEGLQAELAVMVADEVVERLEANNSMNQRMQKLESQMVEIREALHLSPSR
jgi:hypothetical protein